jgi:FkbM family methyltransferase
MRCFVRVLWIAAVGCSVGATPVTSQSTTVPKTPAAHRSHDATARHSFHDVEHWKSVFDDPKRDTWQKPADVVGALRLKPGMTVADLGAGTGYFLRYLSAAVGENGTVFAVEVEPKLLEHLRQRVEEENIGNVVPVLASAHDPRLPYRQLDVVLIVDTYHHFDDRLVYLRRLSQVLKPGGRVAVIDWFKRDLPEGPPLEHKLSREHVVDEMRLAGYDLIEEPTLLPYQYFLIFKRSTAN